MKYIKEENFNNEETIKLYKETKDIELRNKIIENNMGLVIDIASNYFHVINSYGDDLISIGVFGLIKAIEKYEIDFETKFSTYAYGIINSNILRGIEEEYGRKSKYYGLYIMRYKRMFVKLYGNDKNMYDSYYMNDVIDEMVKVKELDENQRLTLIAAITSMNTFSEITPEMEEIQYDEDDVYPSVEHEYIKNRIDYLLEPLDEKSKELVLYRYGFIDGRERTLRELSEMHNITFQGIDERLKKCLIKIRSRVDIVK